MPPCPQETRTVIIPYAAHDIPTPHALAPLTTDASGKGEKEI